MGTVRPEFLGPLLASPELEELSAHTFLLRPLRREALITVIEGPARLADIEVDRELVTRLARDADTGEALPLLAFTLEQLAEGVGRGGRLSMARYDQLGGVQGALIKQADLALAEALAKTHRTRDQVLAPLLQLVAVDDNTNPSDGWSTKRPVRTSTRGAGAIYCKATIGMSRTMAPLSSA